MDKLPTIAIIGLGNMGEALLAGLLDEGVATPETILGVEARTERASDIEARFGIKVFADTTEIDAAQIIVIAVKPKDAEAALRHMKDRTDKLYVSICAGLKLSWFAAELGHAAAVVRVMPNTPALIGEGASVYCPGKAVSPAQCILVETLLGAVGRVFRADDEGLMDAVTGLSGSGPAFVYLFLEALADGGVAAGLSRELARELAAQTVIGAAKMAQSAIAHTGELKDRVTSPAGTTIEGVRTLEAKGMRSAVMEAVIAATARSKALGG